MGERSAAGQRNDQHRVAKPGSVRIQIVVDETFDQQLRAVASASNQHKATMLRQWIAERLALEILKTSP